MFNITWIYSFKLIFIECLLSEALITQTIQNKTDKNSCPSGVYIPMGGDVQCNNLDSLFEGDKCCEDVRKGRGWTFKWDGKGTLHREKGTWTKIWADWRR